MTNVLLIIIGVAGVLWGADRFTDGACSIAERLNVPQIVIGLTVVAFGTSLPEFFVSLVSALHGASGMAVGNVVGSNIFNALLIVGLAAAIAPMSVQRGTVRGDIPWAAGASVLLIVLALDGQLSRLDSVAILAAFILFMAYTLRQAKSGAGDGKPAASMSLPRSVAGIVIGLACLVVGSNMFVSGATDVASALGVSDAVIGLTIVAGGTSLPELATSVVSARKGQSAIAIGNVVGSNVFNILFILGTTGLVCPMSTASITAVDWAMLLVSCALLWLMSRTRYTIERWEGALMLAVFTAYMSWLVYNA